MLYRYTYWVWPMVFCHPGYNPDCLLRRSHARLACRIIVQFNLIVFRVADPSKLTNLAAVLEKATHPVPEIIIVGWRLTLPRRIAKYPQKGVQVEDLLRFIRRAILEWTNKSSGTGTDAFNRRAWGEFLDINARKRNLYSHDATPFYCYAADPYGKIKSYSPVLEGISTSGRSFSPKPTARARNRYRPARKSLKVKRPNSFVSVVCNGSPDAVSTRTQAPGAGFKPESSTCPPI